VHKRSVSDDAIPLLYIHGWPGCFLEVHKIIGPLTSPIPTPLHPRENSPSFHVVAPSIPGFGFSDASKDGEFGLRPTAEVFDKLMKKLGYERYVVYGSNCGFTVARVLSIIHPSSCLALLTTTDAPNTTPISPSLWTRIPLFTSKHQPTPPKSTTFPSDALAYSSIFPQTTSFALCDSPAGLLASLLHHLYASNHLHLWSPSDVLNWCMLLWLPGPEGALRWLHNTRLESAAYENAWSSVPMGLHVYRPLVEEVGQSWTGVGRDGGILAGLGRLGAWMRKGWSGNEMCGVDQGQKVVWRKISTGSVGIPSWDAGGDVILALREFCAAGLRDGWLIPETVEPKNEKTVVDGSKSVVRNQVEERSGSTPAVPDRSGYLSWLWPRGGRIAPSDEEKQQNPAGEVEQIQQPLSPATPMTMIVVEPSSPRPATAIKEHHDSKHPATQGLGIREMHPEAAHVVPLNSSHIQNGGRQEDIQQRPFTLKWPLPKKVKERDEKTSKSEAVLVHPQRKPSKWWPYSYP
jgi:pimeloyl-ACP methyl ester carboxylesterase